MSSLESK